MQARGQRRVCRRVSCGINRHGIACECHEGDTGEGELWATNIIVAIILFKNDNLISTLVVPSATRRGLRACCVCRVCHACA
jgi:hypothetical protein